MREPAAFDRARALRRLEEDSFDVVIVGGGITGAGVAVDAAARGLRTALVERNDFASGTSSKSSKLVHGGLRYLQQREIRLVYEALAERQRLRRNAPHLVRVLPFLLPVFGREGVIPRKLARALGSAMWMYDLTGGARIGRLHRRISAEEAHAHMPTLRRDRLAASYLYYDARADDARLTLALARTAALDLGAAVVNRCTVVGVPKDDVGRIRGVEVDADGRRFEIRARGVVNATGVWADRVRALDETGRPAGIRPAKGVHITVPWDRIRNDIAVVIPVPRDKRSVFVVPWGDRTYIGTTDTDYEGPLDDPQCTSDDVDYLLAAVNHWIPEPIGRRDIVGTWAGLRPLVADTTVATSSGRTSDLSRRHRVEVSPGGMVTVTGGKLTTYRQMAADTVDALVEAWGERPAGVARHSGTHNLRLVGAAGHDEARMADVAGLTPEQVRHLAARYGGEAEVLFAMIQADPSLAEPLVAPLPYLRAEAVHAARYEMATTLDDVLARRTRALLLDRDASVAAAPAVAELLAPVLGWDDVEQAAQVEAYQELAEAERRAADLPAHALEQAVGA